jgi:hypothetical protein
MNGSVTAIAGRSVIDVSMVVSMRHCVLCGQISQYNSGQTRICTKEKQKEAAVLALSNQSMYCSTNQNRDVIYKYLRYDGVYIPE